jgi:cytochrome c biogenesis protein CcdA
VGRARDRRRDRALASTADEVVAYVVFVLVATVGVGAPVVIHFALGDRSASLLERLKNWMTEHNAMIRAVLLLVIGVKLIGDAISGFST